MVVILIIAFIIIISLCGYACCVASKKADEQDEKTYKEFMK